MKPWTGEGGYFNFAERPCDADAILPAETCARLAEVKRHGTPTGSSAATTQCPSIRLFKPNTCFLP